MNSTPFLLLIYFHVALGSNEIDTDRQEPPTIIELWIQREWFELNTQVDHKKNIEDNEIHEGQSLLEGV